MDKMKQVCMCVIVLSLSLVCSQYAQSPCPGIFDFGWDGSTVYGRIVLRPIVPVQQLIIRLNFTLAAPLYSNYIGSIHAENQNNLLQKYNQGIPAVYHVHFPVSVGTSVPIPKLTSLTVNGQSLCSGPGDYPGSNQYVTTLSLQHTSLLQGGTPGYTGNTHTHQHNHNHDQGLGTDTGSEVYIIENVDSLLNNVENTSRLPVYPPNPPPTRATRPPPPVTMYNPPEPTREEYTERPAPNRNSDSYNGECGKINNDNTLIPLVYNGSPYNRGDLPWLVAIYRKRSGTLTFSCGGTLVSDRHVVTAAHCMLLRRAKTPRTDIVVKIGVHNLDEWTDEYTINSELADAHIHESYNDTTLENDIMVMTLKKRVTFNNYIRPACLWKGNTDLARIVGASGVVAGWGEQTSRDPGVGEPQLVRLPIVSNTDCRASNVGFHFLTSHKTLCAGDRKGDGPCKGDSGGGLYILDTASGAWQLRGIVSRSLQQPDGSCNLEEFVIFTDTAKYLPWIKNVLSKP